MRCTLRHDEVIKRATATENVYSDSVLGLGKVQDPSEGNAKWKDQFQYFQRSNENNELFGFDGEQIEYVKDRLRHDESSSDISMNSENIHIRYCRDLLLHRCRQHCTWTRVAKRIWVFSRILNLRASKACSGLQE